MSERIELLHVDVSTLFKLSALSSICIDHTGTAGQVVHAIAAQRLSELNFNFAACGLPRYSIPVTRSRRLAKRPFSRSTAAARHIFTRPASLTKKFGMRKRSPDASGPSFAGSQTTVPQVLRGDCRRCFWKQTRLMQCDVSSFQDPQEMRLPARHLSNRRYATYFAARA